MEKGSNLHGLVGAENAQGLARMKREAMPESATANVVSHTKVASRTDRRNRSKYPGFRVDYAGPRTHPPAHN